MHITLFLALLPFSTDTRKYFYIIGLLTQTKKKQIILMLKWLFNLFSNGTHLDPVISKSKLVSAHTVYQIIMLKHPFFTLAHPSCELSRLSGT